MACSRAGGGCRRGRPLPLRGSGGVTPGKIFEIFDAKSRVWGQFGPENKLIEGQPNEYDMICRNASVLVFHLLPTIFARAPFRLQNICRNSVPPRSRTTTPLTVTWSALSSNCKQSFVLLALSPELLQAELPPPKQKTWISEGSFHRLDALLVTQWTVLKHWMDFKCNNSSIWRFTVRFASPQMTENDIQEDPTTRGSEPLNRIWDH